MKSQPMLYALVLLLAAFAVSTQARAANQAPVITAISGPASPFTGTVLTFTATATDAENDPITFNWTFGDGQGATSNGNTITHTYTSPNTFQVTCTVKDPFSTGNSTSIAVSVSPPGHVPPVIASVTASLSLAKTSDAIVFTAAASDADNDPLTFKWSFGDGSPTLNTPSATVTHSFPQGGTFTVTCTVGDTFATGNSATVSITILAPNSGGIGVGNIADTLAPVINPLNGISIQVTNSEGGVVELNVNVDALNRAAFDVSTDFDGISSVVLNTVKGTHPVNKFTNAGIFVATSSAIDKSTNTVAGMGRKTLVISRKETGEPSLVSVPPPSPSQKKFVVTMKKSTGKLGLSGAAALAAPKPDIFTFTGSFELPEGLDVSQTQDFQIGIGNIVDHATLDAKGRGMTTGDGKTIKKVQIKYPKVDKASMKTKAGQMASITVTLSTTNMVLKGFGTEGVSAKPKSNTINIQFAMLLAGVPYQFTIPAVLKVSKNEDSIAISTTASR